MARVEDSHQKAFMQWFWKQYPALKEDIHHFANERQCTGRFGKHLQDMGVSSGVADIHLAIPHNGFSGLWIELKVLRGRLLPTQKDFLSRKAARGYSAWAAWGWESAKEIIIDYLKGFDTKSIPEYTEFQYKKSPDCQVKSYTRLMDGVNIEECLKNKHLR